MLCKLAAAVLLFTSASSAGMIEQEFAGPPRIARPIGWWHWINGNVSKEGIRADMHYGTLRELANQHGMKFYAKAYAGYLDEFSAGEAVDVPMAEFWIHTYSKSCQRATSIAHTMGKPIESRRASFALARVATQSRISIVRFLLDCLRDIAPQAVET